MSRSFIERLADAERLGYVDFSTNVEPTRVRRPRDSVEDRTSAELLRRDGASDGELVERFGYLPTPIGSHGD